MTARDQVSAVANGGCSGCGEATPERSRLFVAGFGSAATSSPPSAVKDFEAERGPRVGIAAAASFAPSADFDAARDSLRVGFASEP
jgi:hypothetical protein